MSVDTADVVVTGGGIIGAAVAYRLAQKGRKVCLIEKKGLAAGASGSNVGLVAVVNKIPGLRLQLCWEGVKAYEHLGEELGMDIEYNRVGGMYVFFNEAEVEKGRAHFEAQRKQGLPTEWISPEEVRAREPAFQAPVLAAIYSPLDGFVNPYATTIAYARAARRLGATIIQGSAVTGIEVGAGRVQAAVHERGRVASPVVVNAAGSWSPEVGRMVGVDIPVTPCRGQVMITPRVPRYRGHVIMGVEPGARQTWSGGVIVGSTPQFVGYDTAVDYHTITEFAHGVLKGFPFMDNLSLLRVWAGLRPATSDDVPILGPVGEPEGYYLATGHFRTGIVTCPPTSQIAADIVTGDTPSIPAHLFSIERFRQ